MKLLFGVEWGKKLFIQLLRIHDLILIALSSTKQEAEWKATLKFD